MTANSLFDFSPFLKMYDPQDFASFFDPETATSWLKAQKIDGLDPSTILAENQKRIDALKQANEEAMAALGTLMKRQATIFEQLMNAARENTEKLDLSGSDNSAHRNMKACSEAIGAAVKLMKQLSDETQTASDEVFKEVSKQVDAAVKAISSM
ncbi:MAG: hypothetical protein GY798_28765 [Hyphomicrobiales bacterium]|nr:hypothetical protein [Hyphomicrobiales bacterium]MCP5074705.1 hypothetical protein [Paracoccaceae bacterium]